MVERTGWTSNLFKDRIMAGDTGNPHTEEEANSWGQIRDYVRNSVDRHNARMGQTPASTGADTLPVEETSPSSPAEKPITQDNPNIIITQIRPIDGQPRNRRRSNSTPDSPEPQTETTVTQKKDGKFASAFAGLASKAVESGKELLKHACARWILPRPKTTYVEKKDPNEAPDEVSEAYAILEDVRKFNTDLDCVSHVPNLASLSLSDVDDLYNIIEGNVKLRDARMPNYKQSNQFKLDENTLYALEIISAYSHGKIANERKKQNKALKNAALVQMAKSATINLAICGTAGTFLYFAAQKFVVPAFDGQPGSRIYASQKMHQDLPIFAELQKAERNVPFRDARKMGQEEQAKVIEGLTPEKIEGCSNKFMASPYNKYDAAALYNLMHLPEVAPYCMSSDINQTPWVTTEIYKVNQELTGKLGLASTDNVYKLNTTVVGGYKTSRLVGEKMPTGHGSTRDPLLAAQLSSHFTMDTVASFVHIKEVKDPIVPKKVTKEMVFMDSKGRPVARPSGPISPKVPASAP